jgi:hypothetical protein
MFALDLLAALRKGDGRSARSEVSRCLVEHLLDDLPN